MDLNEHISKYLLVNDGNARGELDKLIGFLKDVPLSWANERVGSSLLNDEFRLTVSDNVPYVDYILGEHMTEEQRDNLGYGAAHATLIVEWTGEKEHPRLDELFTFGTDDFHTVWGIDQFEEDEGEECGYRRLGPDKSFVGLFYKLDGDEEYRFLEIYFWEPLPP